MTTEQQEKLPRENSQQNFVTRFFPWIIAAGVLLIYLITLNHWVTLTSLPVVAKITGLDWHPANISWRPSSIEPLHFVLTYPFRWLSGNAQLIGLNLFSAVCGALTLALPQSLPRTQQQGSFSGMPFFAPTMRRSPVLQASSPRRWSTR